jgi:beta-glucosidase
VKGSIGSSFLWGTGVGAYQHEGDNPESDWTDFGRPPAGNSAGFLHRFEEDLDRAASLGTNAFRFGMEWSRIEPRPGERSGEAVRHYDRLVNACLSRGLRPLVTLVQFSLPRWCGGWLRPETERALARHAAWVAEHFGDRVDLFVTLNEPNVAASAAHVGGLFPPGHHLRFSDGDRALLAQLRAHAACHRAIHDTFARVHPSRSPAVGVSMQLVAWHAGGWDPGGGVRSMSERFNWGFLDALADGRLRGARRTVHVPEALGSVDFLGINYFMGRKASWRGALEFAGLLGAHPAPCRSDLGWPIDPAGLELVLGEAHRRYGLPLLITENGVADANDAFRARFLEDHVAAMQRARDRGARVEGYFHWSLLDGFEWHEGYRGRFGLYDVDFVTQERTERPSADTYRRLVARARSVGETPRADNECQSLANATRGEVNDTHRTA